MSEEGKKIVIKTGEGDSTPAATDTKAVDINDSTPKTVEDHGATDTSDTTDITDSRIDIEGTSYQVDKDGNAIGSDGNVYKTKDELADINKDDIVDVKPEVNTLNIDDDGVVTSYVIDDNGNALDDKGEVKYTKEELETLGTDTPQAVDINIASVIDSTKIPIFNQDNEAVSYENTNEGLSQYVEDVYQRGSTEATNNVFSELYSKYPFLNNMLNHVDAGGTVEDFREETDYASIKLDKDNITQLKAIAIEGYMSKGMSSEEANKYFDYVKSTGSDNDEAYLEATKELKHLTDSKSNRDTKKQQDIQLQQQAEQSNYNNYWGVQINDKGQLVNLNKENSIYNIVQEGTLKVGEDTFNIPDNIRVMEDGKPKMYNRSDFFRYLYEPIVVLDNNGNRITTTRDNIKMQKEQSIRTVSNDVLDSYKRFTNYDISQLINEKVNNQKVKEIRTIVINNKNKNKKGGSVKHKGTTKRKIVINTNG